MQVSMNGGRGRAIGELLEKQHTQVALPPPGHQPLPVVDDGQYLAPFVGASKGPPFRSDAASIQLQHVI